MPRRAKKTTTRKTVKVKKSALASKSKTPKRNTSGRTVKKITPSKTAKQTTPARRSRITPKKINLKKTAPANNINKGPWAESYISLLLGIVFVVVGVIALASFLKTNRTKQITSTSIVVTSNPKVTVTQVTNTPTPTSIPLEKNGKNKTYTVQPNDDLWHIAEKVYGSGYNWVDIARANNLANPSTIYKGDKLVLPTNVTKEPSTISSTPTSTPLQTNNQMPSINTNTYTVKSGDDLWHIALRAYGNGYKWVDIAKANNLANPSMIFSGNILKLPRDSRN